MTEIVINKGTGKYKIERDTYCFILTKYRRTTESWEVVGYYKEIQGIIKKLISISIMEHADLKKVTDIVDATCKKLSAQIERAL